MSTESVIDRYATWLPYPSAADRDRVREEHARVSAICAEDPNAPKWITYFYGWTLAAFDSSDPAGVLAGMVAAERGNPEELGRALVAFGKCADEWSALRTCLSGCRRVVSVGPHKRRK